MIPSLFSNVWVYCVVSPSVTLIQHVKMVQDMNTMLFTAQYSDIQVFVAKIYGFGVQGFAPKGYPPVKS